MNRAPKQICSVCGHKGSDFEVRETLTPDLIRQWRLHPRLKRKITLRESCFCPVCGNSTRTRSLAQAILQVLPLAGTTNLQDWVIAANYFGLKVAEINSCAFLHHTLSYLDNLSYSEYILKEKHLLRLKFWIKGIGHQDIEKLTYPSKCYDLVLHSEVLEHVNNPSKALSECRRILKKNGVCLFTVPLIKSRQTKRRAKILHGQTKYLEEPSYHGSGGEDNLVFWEYGGDIIKKWGAKIVLSDPENEIYVLSISS